MIDAGAERDDGAKARKVLEARRADGARRAHSGPRRGRTARPASRSLATASALRAFGATAPGPIRRWRRARSRRRSGDALDHRVGGRKRRFAQAIGGAKALDGRFGLVGARAHARGRAARRGRPRPRSARARSGRPRDRSRRRRAPGRRRARPPRARPRARRCSTTKPARLGRRLDEDRRAGQKLVRARNEILRAAERGDHALEPLRRRAGLERAFQGRRARVDIGREARERHAVRRRAPSSRDRGAHRAALPVR